MRRSLTRRANRRYDASARRWPEIVAVAVFPPDAFDPLPPHWTPGEGYRPFAWGRWLRTTGEHLWDATVVVGPLSATLDNDEGEVWTVAVTRDGTPNLYNIYDKINRVRWAERSADAHVIEIRDVAEAPASQLMDALDEQHGFIPQMGGFLWRDNPYGGRWYLAMTWIEPTTDNPLTQQMTYHDFLSLLDSLITKYHAKIRFYPHWVNGSVVAFSAAGLEHLSPAWRKRTGRTRDDGEP